ncbi:MAG: NAD-dependent succinate-semialdehyde dehydrogenase [Alphaproteobacteria bacterium]|nr:NAD-dependent succinate-semialdehyde dehydrogenase [Alphaproteobacteria bacterium]
MQLSDSRLFRAQAYLDGAWTGADSKKTFDVFNPATGEKLGAVPSMGGPETKRAIDAAARAMPEWARRTAKDRAAVLRKWFELILANKDDLAKLMTAEQGKPLAESLGEVVYGASFIEWFAEEGKRIYGDTIPAHAPDKRLLVLKQPIGVVAAITPWNFPNAMITRKCAPALAAGCTVVIKPAEDTPYSALALAELADRAGFPKGVISVLTGIPEEIGAEMTANPTVRKLSFTGSTEVGKLLMRQCADTVKKVSLELGGNAPFIVFDDADLDLAVAGAVASKYRNTGQTCVCANRIMVQEKIFDKFVSRLAQTVSGFKVGDGLKGETNQGPLINKDAIDKVERLVEDAKKKGARVVIGGKKHGLGGTFYEPTVLTNVTTGMDFFREEIFGPVAPIYKFKTEDEAIRMANDTPYGLAGYFYSRDLNRMWRVAEGLEYGLVGVNDGVIGTDAAPFGGVKESGIGREGSKYGIEDFVEIKYVCIGSINR